MANPFKDTINRVVKAPADQPPSYDTLAQLSGYLANQEDKIHALRCGVLSSLFSIYDATRTSSSFDPTRHILTHMMESLITLMEGRELLISTIGLERVLTLLNDSAPAVRASTCHMLGVLVSFPDVKHAILVNRHVITPLYRLFLEDITLVSRATIIPLTYLTQWDQTCTSNIITKAMEMLNENIQSSDRNDLALAKQIIQMLWNLTCDSKAKEVAIDVRIVDIIAPLLEHIDTEVRRVATGTLMAITVAERGKIAVIEKEGCIKNLCTLVLDTSTWAPLRINAVQTIRNVAENPKGLTACGELLITEPDILVEIVGVEATSRVLSPGLSSSDTTRILNALRCLFYLVKEPEGRSAAWDILEIIPILANMSRSSDTSIRSLATRCIPPLVDGNEDAQQEYVRWQAQHGDVEEKPREVAVGSNHLIIPSKTALILCEIQNDWFTKNGICSSSINTSHIIWHIIDTMERARKSGVVIIHAPLIMETQAMLEESKPIWQNTPYANVPEVLSGRAFVPNSWGARLIDEITPASSDIILTGKHTPDAFPNTGLLDILKSRGITTVVVAGLLSNGAVESTGRTAADHGMRVITLTDCTTTLTPDVHASTIKDSYPTFSTPLTHTQFLARVGKA